MPDAAEYAANSDYYKRKASEYQKANAEICKAKQRQQYRMRVAADTTPRGPNGLKLCSKCQTNERSRSNDAYCAPCRKEIGRQWQAVNKENKKQSRQEYYKANKAAIGATSRNNALKRKYGISQSDYEGMCEEQGNLCAICNTPGKEQQYGIRLAVDHCHVSGKVRKLLCFQCNSLLGQSNDNISILNKAIKYLQEHV